MNALKCPNSACPYLFDPSGVPAGVVLTCPRCGMRFTLGPPPAGGSPPPPAVPSADLDFGAPGEIARPRREAPTAAGGSGARTTIALVVVGVALLLGVGATIYFRLARPDRRTDPGGAGGTVLPDLGLAVDPPGDGWVADDDLRAKLGPPFVLAYRKGDPAAPAESDPCLAFAAKDYVGREPRPAELRDGLTRPLGAVLEDISPTDLPGQTWLGRPAAAVEFRARLKGDGPTVAGQAVAVGHKGVGYWAVGWAAEADAAGLAPAMAAARGKARLLDGREKWAPKEAAVRVFAGRKAAYELADTEGVWAESDVPDPDPLADLVLVSKERQKGRDIAAEGTAVVLVLDNLADEPTAVARKAVEAHRVAELANPARAITFTELPDTPESVPPVVRLQSKVADDKNQTRLHAVSAVRVGDRVVVVNAWCYWSDKGALEDRLVRLAASLREKK